MALTIQDVLNDAKKLSNRLREQESSADGLVSQLQSHYQEVQAMKQVCVHYTLYLYCRHTTFKYGRI